MLDLLVIQPTPFCNIDCSYCYLPDRNNSAKISLSTIEKTAQRLIESDLLKDELTIVFHAGEPLVAGIKFYDKVFEIFNQYIKPKVKQLNYAIQTNGILIDDYWCELINRENIRIGISIDGPEHIHDYYRKTRSGKGTFEKVMQGVHLLKKHQINYHGIAVVTEQSLNYAKDIFDFYYQNGFYLLGLNIEEQEGINSNSSLYNKNLESQIFQFFSEIFNLYFESDKHMSIRELNCSMGAILREPGVLDIKESKINSHQLYPYGIITVDYKGNFSTFSPELLGQVSQEYNDFIIGNVFDIGFEMSKNTIVFQKLSNDIQAGVEKCKKECKYYHLCGGGAPSNKFYENKSFISTETKYCKYHIQYPLEISLSLLEKRLAIN